MDVCQSAFVFHVLLFLLISQHDVEATKKKKYVLKHVAKKMKIPNHELAVSHCVAQPCGPHGNCVVDMNEKTGIICYCKAGFTGIRCEIEIEECDQTPCLNRGTCESTEKGFLCSCPESYTGKHCETGTGPIAARSNVGEVEEREEPEKEKVRKGANTLVGLIIFSVVSCWLCCCLSSILYRKHKKKQASYKYEECPIEFGDPKAIRGFADKAVDEKRKEEEREKREKEWSTANFQQSAEFHAQGVEFEGAVTSKVFGEEEVTEEDAIYKGDGGRNFGWVKSDKID